MAEAGDDLREELEPVALLVGDQDSQMLLLAHYVAKAQANAASTIVDPRLSADRLASSIPHPHVFEPPESTREADIRCYPQTGSVTAAGAAICQAGGSHIDLLPNVRPQHSGWSTTG
jgi:hypothetical protein